MSKFLVSMIGDETFMEEATPELMEEVVAQMDDYNEELADAGVFVDGRGPGPERHREDPALRRGRQGGRHRRPLRGDQGAGRRLLDLRVRQTSTRPSSGPEGPRSRAATIEVRPIVDTPEENLELFHEQAKRA